MLNRREFLQTSVVGAATLAAPAIVRGQNLNSKLQIAGIGCEGKGWDDIRNMASHPAAQYVAFCDVDLGRTANARKLNPEAPVHQDFRELFAERSETFDAVTVSTPDHMHAIIGLEAMRRGKHVYCQKPLTHSVWEARQMTLEAKRSGVITRLGNQIHSAGVYRTAVRAVRDGVIGKVRRVHSWCSTTGHGKSFHISRPRNPPAPPESLNWDLWVGVAPLRPFGGWNVYHPWGWRDWQDFGNGALGDFGCHILDPVFSALDITGAPIDFVADHTGMNDEVWPAQTSVKYTFPGTPYTTGETLSLSWDDGGRLPSTGGSHLPPNEALPSSGSLFVGEKGSLVLPHVGAPTAYPELPLEPAEDLNHYHGWIDGCLSGEQPSDGFAYGGPLTEAVLLGNIAVRYRTTKLEWDAGAMRITNHEEANRWLRREERDGWDITPVAAG